MICSLGFRVRVCLMVGRMFLCLGLSEKCLSLGLVWFGGMLLRL